MLRYHQRLFWLGELVVKHRHAIEQLCLRSRVRNSTNQVERFFIQRQCPLALPIREIELSHIEQDQPLPDLIPELVEQGERLLPVRDC